jgi:3-oxoacid CoA-transferase B subunit
MDDREKMARRAALEFTDGDTVNLGFGMPMAVANYIPQGVNVVLETENGALGMGPTPRLGNQDSDNGNAGGMPISLVTGASIFDACTSFGIIRGGHVDAAILGALEVDQEGNLANWSMPKRSPGMGGAMDLVTGARKIIIMMQHNDKNGGSKILKKCTLPLTGVGVVDVIVTEKAVFHVTAEGLVLKEKVSDITVEELKANTDAEFTVAEDICQYRL